MRFYDLLEAVRGQPQALTIPAEWAQGRASFGGLVVALQYEACLLYTSPSPRDS